MPLHRPHPLRAVATALATGVLLVATAAAPASAASLGTAAVGAAPGAPVVLVNTSTIEGVRLVWQPAAWNAAVPWPTSWQVDRIGGGSDRSWTLATSGGGNTELVDDDLVPGVEATYSITGIVDGVVGPATSVGGQRVPTSGPFTGAGRSLSMRWDTPDGARRSTVLPGPDGRGPTIVPIHDTVGFSGPDGFKDGNSPVVGLPWPLTDGTHRVGRGPGELSLIAASGGGCPDPVGTVVVDHSGPSRTGWYRTLSLDADVTCSDGQRLRVEARYDTPEPVAAITAAPETLVESSAGTTGSAPIIVRNTGGRAVTLGAPTMTWFDGADPRGVVDVTASACTGVTLLPGGSCRLDVVASRPAGTPVSVQYGARVSIASDAGEWTIGHVVATAAHDEVLPTTSVVAGPLGVDVSWTTPLRLAFRVSLREDGTTVPTTTTTGSTLRASGLAPGAHRLQLRLETPDGWVYDSAVRRVVVPEEWVLGATGTGVRAIAAGSDPDLVEGRQVGEWDGGRTMTDVLLASSPTRTESVATDMWGPSAWFFTPSRVTRTLRLPAMWATPRYRPDGAVLAVQRPARAPDGTTYSPAILLQDRASGTVTEVPGSSGWGLADWTPDGRELLVLKAGGGLSRMDPATGRTTGIRGAEDVISARVSRTGRLAVVGPGGFTIEEMPLAGGPRHSTSIYVWGRDFAWNPAGTMIAVGSPAWMTTGTGELWDVSGTPRKLRDIPTSRSVTWWDPVSSAPAVSVSVPRWTTATPTLGLTATDADDAVGGLTLTCSLDGAPATPCASTWRPGNLAAGTHTATVRVTDPSGATGQRSVTWSVDASAPTASVGALPTAVLGSVVTPTWSGADAGGSGVATYDVRYRRAPVSAGLGAYTYPAALQGTTLRSTKLTMTRGDQYCFSARARDAAGNAGAWGAERCTVSALDDRSLSAGKGWSRGTSSLYLYGTYTRGVSTGASLTLPKVSTRRVGLVVTRCSTCGSVDVLVGSTRLARVSLVGKGTAYKQVVWLPTQTATRTGTLTIRTTSSRPAVVDAVLVVH